MEMKRQALIRVWTSELDASGAQAPDPSELLVPGTAETGGETVRLCYTEHLTEDTGRVAARTEVTFTADPEKAPTATKFTEITYDEVIQRGLKVMDITATAMARENGLPIYVFNMDQYGNLEKVINGESIGTLVKP